MNNTARVTINVNKRSVSVYVPQYLFAAFSHHLGGDQAARERIKEIARNCGNNPLGRSVATQAAVLDELLDHTHAQ